MPIIVSSSSSMRQWFWSEPPTDAPYSPATVERFSGAHDVACFRRSHFIATTIVAPGCALCVTSKMFSPVWKSNLRRVRPESPRRPPRHRRDACSIAWRCRFFTARQSQRGHVVAVHPTHWLISTQVDAPPVSLEAIDQAAELTKGKVAEGGAATDDAVKKAVVGPAQ